MADKQITNPFWGEGEKKGFGQVAIEYAAGEDVVLDQQLVQYECLVNQAHVVMLYKQKLITKKVAKGLLKGLREIQKLDGKGKFKLKPELEDVHSNVEQWLIDKYGIEVGGYLRLGIARNDQVYTDTRMWMKDHLLILAKQLEELVSGLSKVAKEHTQTVMPGYTHLRISQPITYGHWLMAKAWHFFDDLSNILTTYDVVDVCPLGIFEMAGTHLPIDRQLTAKLLGFEGVTPNSLYTANQRGELEIKLLSDLSLLALHIRRTMTELIMFSTHEFGLVEIDDLYTSGGTAQPNLKNPDTLEVVRANMAKMSSAFMETLMIMDPLPSGFMRDTQQSKPVLFAAVKLMEKALPVVSGVMTSLKPNKNRMAEVADLNFSVAPDVAVQLAIKGDLSFRQAYQVVKALIREGYLKQNFSELTPEMIEQVSAKVLGKKITLTQAEIDEVATAEACVMAHTSEGGPAPQQVNKQITLLEKEILKIKKKVLVRTLALKVAKQKLIKEVDKIVEQRG